ncbi:MULTISPECIES: helix-turn-helix transcriptional regulator [Romboutsia]|uniref:Helix-turn-helix n=1 Tax=Romboutsia hominis TaxID=1507512 RepID=A0A2P2BTA5_9FIRM|nr:MULTISPECIES: helix-turn-helix transcriptional regulator [Romboutsia]MCH1960855.1 helix-turn-helix domain-containing protein [Romboutsia hominis]MCH1968711.1 helix-turn-helix domain-containing protein [Romboutsia hominis]MDB8789638.1 helix-turn-helix transcriptional regulator [Romboutsia sp. 1001216sp1]MDB8793025.1 helix-turn-helix transcriptional regulator [Romboutsia sp. 1001216sp1]MDB8795172.1 helix-turn-helix transcriptional regulator [Romboutsia sp. 1001216sp1]
MGLRILKSKRALFGLTQVKVANMMGMNTKTYNLKENGRVDFSLEEVVKISKVLNLNIKEVNEIFLNLDIEN